jgi:hypothetical protein
VRLLSALSGLPPAWRFVTVWPTGKLAFWHQDSTGTRFRPELWCYCRARSFTAESQRTVQFHQPDRFNAGHRTQTYALGLGKVINQMKPSEFLNLDLELRSKSDLAPLASHLDRCASLLHSGHFEGEFMVTAEPFVGGHANQSPQSCTEEFLNTLDSLPRNLHFLFEGCHQRQFDYGFDGGFEARPCTFDLPASQLSRMSQLGIDLRVTVYPYRADRPKKKK